MRPKAPPLQQKPWQRKAFQYAAYAFWPMLVVWVIYSYPSGGRGSAAARLPAELRPLGRDTKTLGAVDGDAALQQPVDVFDEGSAAEWELDGSGKSADSGKQQQQQQQLEHVATVGGGTQVGGTGADAGGRVYSSCTIYAVRNGSGQLAKYYYKFANVRLTRKTLYFFMPPGMHKPEELWVDFISGNATSPKLPTMVVIKGEVQRQKWFYLPVKYTQAPSNCAAWTNKPTYFLQVRYSYNIWHTWNEGLMGAFQTLREQGLLPLVQVDEAGNMREVTEGLLPQCPLVFDVEANTTREEEGCAKRLGVVSGTHCDIKNQAWCRPGVVSYRRFEGPIILAYTAASVMNRWAQVYDSMSTDIRDFSLVDGHCFKSFIMGKTNTLNYYQAMNLTQTQPANPFIRERVEAMAVFKQFVSTAQREFVAAEKAKNPAAVEFRGYVSPKMELLRRGIGPEQIALVDNIAPSEVPGLLREELPQLKEMWAKRRQEVAKIEAAWKQGKQVVDLREEEESAEGGGGGQVAGTGAKKEPEDEGAKGAAGGGKEEEEAEGAAGAAKAKAQGGKESSEEESAGGGGGGGEGGKGKKRGLRGGEGSARRKLREPGRRLGGGALGGGEGGRRRLPRRDGRALLQDAAQQQQQPEEKEEEGAAAGAAATAAAAGAGDTATADAQQQQQAAGEQADTLVGEAGGDGGSDAAAADARAQSQAAAAGEASPGVEGEGSEEEEVERQSSEREAALKAMPAILKRSDEFVLESPRPVVAYMSRNFFSRGVLNEHDILRYILAKYNVTLRVTTFEEPLLEAMDLLQHADVLIGMHGAGWTNGMFVKHGAVAMQMFPYGWRLPDNSTIRGYNYREIVLASECRYIEWVSQRWDYAFFRRIDFNKRVKMEYVLHPDPNGPHPEDGWPGNPWIYQNTYVDMEHFGPYIDTAMAAAGIKPVDKPIPVSLN